MNSIRKPKISVIMSVKDDQSTIANSINSILLQTYQNFELLIMNDASNDNTPEIISKFIAKDKRIKLYSNKENLGLTASLNILAKKSSGEFIARQDGDDISFLDRLENQLSFIATKKLDGCTTKAISIQDSKILHNKTRLIPNRLLIKFKNPFIHGSLLIRREVLDEINYYNEEFYYAQDYKLVTDLLNAKFKIKILNKVLYKLNTINNISTLNKEQQRYYAKCVRNKSIPLQIHKIL